MLELLVQTLPATIYGQPDPFASTHWSVIAQATRTDVNPEISGAALEQLCQLYWPPLYTFVRARGYATHDAQDLTQGFFAHLIEHKIYTRTNRAKGKFRAFLLASLKNFLSDARDHNQTLRRGGGRHFVPLDEGRAEAAESLFKSQDCGASLNMPEDQRFERACAETLVTTALDRIAASYDADGKGNLFRELQTFLTLGAAPLPTYAELAIRLGAAESTLRSHVTRLRARFRQVLREEVRRTVSSEAQVDDELRELLRVLTGP